MGMPNDHEQPVLLLMERTIRNYEDIKRRAIRDGPFEVTQLINSFLAVVAHPWDQLLDKDLLKSTSIEQPNIRRMGFPLEPPFPGERGVPPDSVHNMLRLLRNSMAHGNMLLLSRSDLRELRPDSPTPRVHEKEIAGVRIWNMRGKTETWSAVLDITELEATLYAMRLFCETLSLWRQDIREEFEKRHPETPCIAGSFSS